MNFSEIQRRSFLIASATMIGAVVLVLCYWQGVRKGVVPSPVQPMVRSTSPPVMASPNAATVTARKPVLAPPRSSEPIAPTNVASADAPQTTHLRSSGATVPRVPAESAPKVARPAPESISTNRAYHGPVPEAVPPPDRPVPSETREAGAQKQATTSAADEQLAAHWLAHRNDRPVIRVRSDTADILKLVELGRGVLVASSKGGTGAPRELYLQSKPGGSPLFAPYTKSVADQFSSYSLGLDAAPALTQLTTVFPVYFPGASVSMAFVPDRALATEVFAQVAQASRSVGSAGPSPDQTVYEGELTLHGTEPQFQLLEVRTGTKRTLVSAAEHGRE